MDLNIHIFKAWRIVLGCGITRPMSCILSLPLSSSSFTSEALLVASFCKWLNQCVLSISAPPLHCMSEPGTMSRSGD